MATAVETTRKRRLKQTPPRESYLKVAIPARCRHCGASGIHRQVERDTVGVWARCRVCGRDWE